MDWFCFYTSPKAENAVEAAVRELGLLAYCPRETVLVRHARREMTKFRPLFPRYLFICTPVLGLVRDVRGLERVVKCGDTALPLHAEHVRQLQEAEMLGAFDRRPKPDPSFEPGDHVKLPNGLLAVVKEMRPDKRVAVMLSFFGATREQVVQAKKLERVS